MLSAGDHFDRYVIEGILGQGGMGVVYRALDPKLGRRVALKVVLLGGGGSSPDAAARLVREARAAAAFDHPNAVSIFDVGEVDGAPYLAMELVSGKTLRAFVGDASVPIATRLGWLADVARALAAGHRAGLVHRDVKPENVMVRDDGVVKVLDFGIARRTKGKVDPTAPTAQALATITAEGVAVGTPLYMAPEQLRGESVDGRSDQFSWGVVAYELLTGHSPWARAGDLLALAAAIASEDVDARSLATTGTSDGVVAVVARALAKSPAARFASMDAIVQALDAERSGTRIPASAALPEARRSRWQIVVAALAVVAGIGALAVVGERREIALPARASGAVDAGRLVATPPPIPTRGKPEAIEDYREGLAAIRDAEVTRADSLLAKAVEEDPTLAEAALRFALLDTRFESKAKALLERAGAYRDSLAPRDRALLEAAETRHARDPLDVEGYARLLGEAVSRAPADVDLRDIYAGALLDTGQTDEAARQIDRVLELDPGFANAWYLRSVAIGRRDGSAAEEASARACVARFPRATTCLELLAGVDSQNGRCADMEALARQERAVDPGSPAPFMTLVDSLMAQERPRDAVEEAFARGLERMPADVRDELAFAGGWQIEVAYGNFSVADEMVRTLASKRPADLHFGAMGSFRRLAIAREVDDRAAGIPLARQALARSVTWDNQGQDAVGEILTLALEVGAIDRRRFEREIVAWRRELMPASTDGGEPSDLERLALWCAGYAQTAVSQADFDDALRRLDALHTGDELLAHLSDTRLSGALGRVLLHGGRAGPAVPHLRRAAASCAFVNGPEEIIRASLDLGEALEATGDAPGACTAYARVLFYWGSAPRSVTAAEARVRAKKLACALPPHD